MILAGHTNSYHGYTLEEALRGISTAGYEYAELTAVPGWADFVRADTDPDDIRTLLERYELTAVAMSTHLELADESSIAANRDLIAWAGDFGLAHVNCALGERGGLTDEAVRSVLTDLASVAEARSIVLGIEVHGSLAPTGASAAALVAGVQNAALGVNYDTGNVEYYGGTAAVTDLPGMVDAVRHMHLKDKLGGKGEWAFPALGGGHVDFTAVRSVVVDALGAMSPASVELEFHGDPWPPLSVVDDAMAVSLVHLRDRGY